MEILAKLLWCECHRAPLAISQNCFRQWLNAVRQQATTNPQCWPRFMSPYGVTSPECAEMSVVNLYKINRVCGSPSWRRWGHMRGIVFVLTIFSRYTRCVYQELSLCYSRRYDSEMTVEYSDQLCWSNRIRRWKTTDYTHNSWPILYDMWLSSDI